MDPTTLTIVFVLISIINIRNTQPPTLQTYHQENSQYRLSYAPLKKQQITLVIASMLQKDWLNDHWRNL